MQKEETCITKYRKQSLSRITISGIRKAAFTLTEVLISLGIIGIVAAMTIPTLIEDYTNKWYITRIKKVYSVVAQAMMFAMPDGDYNNIPITSGGLPGVENFFNDYLKEYFLILKICDPTKTNTSCWADIYCANSSKEKYATNSSDDRLAFISKDGTAYYMDTWNASDYNLVSTMYGINFSGTSHMLVMYIDINGLKTPNTLGKDVFIFVFSERGFLPAGHDKNDDEIESECATTGRYCFERLIRNNWKFD